MKIFNFLLIFSICHLNGCGLLQIRSEANMHNANEYPKKYKRLPHFLQTESEIGKVKAYLLIHGSDLKDMIKSIKIYFPSHASVLLESEDVQLCSYEKPQDLSKINCLNKIPFLTKINKSKHYIQITPKIAFSKVKNYAVKVNIPDKKRSGIYQINVFSNDSRSEDDPYLGSWRLDLK